MLLLAILCVTLIATVGAIASRLLRFNYGYLTVLSLAVYATCGFFIAGIAGFNMVLLASLIVGSYDATVGWKLAKVCRANFVVEEEELEKMTYAYTIKVMLLVGPTFFSIGYLARNVIGSI